MVDVMMTDSTAGSTSESPVLCFYNNDYDIRCEKEREQIVTQGHRNHNDHRLPQSLNNGLDGSFSPAYEQRFHFLDDVHNPTYSNWPNRATLPRFRSLTLSMAATLAVNSNSTTTPLKQQQQQHSYSPYHTSQQSIMSLHHNPHHYYPHDQSSPGSPPELSNSKSTKSSYSSSVSETIAHDLAHFEDITLDDVQGEAYLRKMNESQATKTRFGSGGRLSAPTSAPRDLTGRQNAQVVSRLGEHVPSPQMTLGLPPKRMSKRRGPKQQPHALLTNLAPYQGSRRARSASPLSEHSSSPNSPSRHGRSAGAVQRPGLGINGAFTHTRRQSWQPGRRKTVQELEDEYHDSDEDLPEDAIIWNVPISPRPPQEREKSKSPRQSWSPGPSPTADVNKGHGLDFSGSANPLPASRAPKSPRLSSLPRSVSMTSIPEDYSLNPRSGTRSWDATLSDLSAEARMLTQVLEEHAEEKEKETERQVQSGSPNKRNPKRTVSTSTIELPPMRRSELMIDPLPVSKEKEKFLTRTRPSWLPPKDPEEEKRHLKQYQQMMAKAQEAEKKKAQKQHVEQCKRDDTRETLAKTWQEFVLPNWDQRLKDPKTRELWWKGITPRDRGHVWEKAIGNDLGLTESSYNLALERAKVAEKRLAGMNEQEAEKEVEGRWFAAIRADVREAFPELKIFQPGGPLHDTLIEVLMAYAMYRSDVGYVYGTHFIAALLILNLSGPRTFITLANILNRPLPTALLTQSTHTVTQSHTQILDLLATHLPSLHTHLTDPRLDLSPADLFNSMLTPLFCAQKFGMDIASRIWDVYVFEGDQALVWAAVATCMRLEGRLYGSEKEDILNVLKSNEFGLGREEDFVAAMAVVGGAPVAAGAGVGEKRPNSW